MKNFLSITTFVLLMLSAKVFAQNNLTWIIIDKYEKGYFKNKLEIKSSFSGFTNASEAAAFFKKIKTNPEITSFETLGKDTKGNYLVSFNVKEPHDGNYYMAMFNKMGVSDVELNGQKKSFKEILAAKENKEHTH